MLEDVSCDGTGFAPTGSMLKRLHQSQPGITLINLLVVLSIMGIIGGLALHSLWHYLPIYRLDAASWHIAHLMVLTRYRAIATQQDWGIVFDEGSNGYTMKKFVNMEPVDTFDQMGPFTLGKGIRYAGRERTPSRPGPTTFYKDRVIFTNLGTIRGISGGVYIADEYYVEGVATPENLRHRRRIVVRCVGQVISVQKVWR
jgi:hypothetical protein